MTRSAFDLMIELNPQVGAALVPVASSAPLVHAVAMLDTRFAPDLRPRLVSALLSLHTTPRGQQALAFFGFERLLPGTADDLAPSIEIARAHERAVRGTK